jgi:hypothetical protein
MKKLIIKTISVIVLSFGFSTLVQSCKSDCEKYCEHGSCYSGDCECLEGYDGKYCDVYVGTGSGSSSSSSSSGTTGSSSGGTSSSSSSSSGGSSLGQVTFWTASDLGCGSITVTVSGYTSASIGSYYTSGISDCGATGCATYNLSPGTYSYSAECSSYTWSDSFTITANGCLKYELQ